MGYPYPICYGYDDNEIFSWRCGLFFKIVSIAILWDD